MNIKRIKNNRKDFLPLLLLADEQESIIDTYLERGALFALYDDDIKSICLVTQESDAVYEIKNMATVPHCQRKGYGMKLVQYVIDHLTNHCTTLLVGTGDTPQTIAFYTRCGFKFSHVVKDYFVQHYDHPIMEQGVQLRDMVYLQISFTPIASEPYCVEDEPCASWPK